MRVDELYKTCSDSKSQMSTKVRAQMKGGKGGQTLSFAADASEGLTKEKSSIRSFTLIGQCTKFNETAEETKAVMERHIKHGSPIMNRQRRHSTDGFSSIIRTTTAKLQLLVL